MAEHVDGRFGLSEALGDLRYGLTLKKAELDDGTLIVGKPAQAGEEGRDRLLACDFATGCTVRCCESLGEIDHGCAPVRRLPLQVGGIPLLPAERLLMILELVQCDRFEPSVKGGRAVETGARGGTEGEAVCFLENIFGLKVSLQALVDSRCNGHSEGGVVVDE